MESNKALTIEELKQSGFVEAGTPKIYENKETGDQVVVVNGKVIGSFYRSLPVTLRSKGPLASRLNQGKNERLTPTFAIDTTVSLAPLTVSSHSENDKSQVCDDLFEIEAYIEEELARIRNQYTGEAKVRLQKMLAHRAALMVVDIDYKKLKLETLDLLFSQFGMTFQNAMELLGRDFDWHEL